MKLCKLCQIQKPLTEFHRNCKSPDGLLHQCRVCISAKKKLAYRVNPTTKAIAVWHGILQRAGNASGRHPTYANIEVRMSRAEFLAWAVPAYRRFERKNPGSRASVDRKDPDGHYEIRNLRVIAMVANQRLAKANKNIHAPKGKAWCAICRSYKPKEAFDKNSTSWHRLSSYCKECTSSARKLTLATLKARAAKAEASANNS